MGGCPSMSDLDTGLWALGHRASRPWASQPSSGLRGGLRGGAAWWGCVVRLLGGLAWWACVVGCVVGAAALADSTDRVVDRVEHVHRPLHRRPLP